MELRNLGEFELIGRWKNIVNSATHPKVLLGIGDDAACLDDLHQPVFSCDALVENVHFRHEWITARQLGWKALAVNISDMAAMGAAPIAATVSLALPAETKTAWIDELYEGFRDAATAFDFAIAGGDTTKAAQIMVSVAIIGEPLGTAPLRRSGAKAGDAVLLTGFTGESAAGLAALQFGQSNQQDAIQHCVERHLRPRPRVAEMRAALQCAGDAIHAAIDVSDGLAGDATHIAEKSSVDLVLNASQIPVSAKCLETAQLMNRANDQATNQAMHWAIAGGEDYELLLCVAPDAAKAICVSVESSTGTKVHQIGVCQPFATVPQVRFQGLDERIDISGSWRHF